MENLNRYQWHIFWIACATTFVVLGHHISILFPLYRDPALRERVGVLIEGTTVREGWLNSGLSLLSVDEKSLTLLYRSHLRGSDPIRCFTLSLSHGSLDPCPVRD